MYSNHHVLLALMIVATIIVTLLLFQIQSAIIQLTATINTEKQAESKIVQPCLERLLAEIKVCLLKRLSKSQSANWLAEAQTCTADLTKTIRIKDLKNKDETKHVILPVNENVTECTVVSLGIGNDILAEQGLRNLVPTCRFYGADPIYQSGIVYKEIGQYYQTAVGGSRGAFTTSVLEEGSYKGKSVEYITLEDFFLMTNITFVDYLFMDAEGGEYGMLKFLEKSKLQQMRNGEGVGGVCQLNIEFHMPLDQHHLTLDSFNELFLNFILSTDYISLYTVEDYHFRTMWIDASNPRCIEKYYSQICNYV